MKLKETIYVNYKYCYLIKIRLDINRPEVSNLLRIYSAISERSIKDIETEFTSKSMKDFKDSLAEIIIKK